MALETKTHLDEKTVDKLQRLIQANMDSHEGFREAADEVDNETLAGLFRGLAEKRQQQAQTLQGLVSVNGEEPRDSGTYMGAAHRTWIELKTAVVGGDTESILNECERGEDHIKNLYEEILKETAGSAVNDVLQRQYAEVKADHDRVRDLRDTAREMD
jgi:uncharacterized protein (TIGR02284 family)